MSLHGAWRRQAACLDHDTDLFFPSDGERAWEAVQICGGCPVLGECRDYALMAPESDGVWGGMTAKERKLWRRRRGLVDLEDAA